jgi:choline dehydrogenase
MVYIRGHAYDYDDWEKNGAVGWSYADCLPYFRKAQSHELGPDDYRGGDGPLRVSRGSQKDQILFKKFIEAGIEAGYPFTNDMNGYQQEGFGWMDSTIYKGRRWSTSTAYLRPALTRKNLTVLTDTFANKVIFEGKSAVGVEAQGRNAREAMNIHSTKEVIQSCYHD